MRTVVIHQPEFFPWSNLFIKMATCDTFVFLDNVQYVRRSFQNRNMINTEKGTPWLTVPVQSSSRDELISNMKIDNSENWKRSHLSILKNAYKGAKHYEDTFSFLEELYLKKSEDLSALNMRFTEKIARRLGFNNDFKAATQINAEGMKSDRILNLCRALNTSLYVAGNGSKTYINEDDFSNSNIEILYIPPVEVNYDQVFDKKGFVKDLSIIDFIFNCGFQEAGSRIRELAKKYKRDKVNA